MTATREELGAKVMQGPHSACREPTSAAQAVHMGILGTGLETSVCRAGGEMTEQHSVSL